MPCPNCDSEIRYITDDPRDEKRPDNYTKFCHIGSPKSEGQTVYIFHTD